MFSLNNLFGDPTTAILKETKDTVDAINALEGSYQGMTDEELRQRTHAFRNRLAAGETLEWTVAGGWVIRPS